MAKFKRARRAFRSVARHARRSASNPGANLMTVGLSAAAYGAARGAISNAIAPLLNNVPVLGQYSDEAVLGLAGALAMKKGKGIVKSIGTAMFIVEAASVGHQLGGAAISGATGGSSGMVYY